MSDLYSYLAIVLILIKSRWVINPILNMRGTSHTANSNPTLLALKPMTSKCSISVICFS